MDVAQIKSIIEGLLFVSGDEGIEAKQIADIVELDQDVVVDLLEDMTFDFRRQQRGIQIIEIAGCYQLTTLARHASYFEKLAHSPSHSTLSQAALETLAIIAYNQPVTRAEVEDIRGVKSEKPIYRLMNKSLIKEVGRKEGLGRAILYGTTKEFLDYFGLRHIEELPPLLERDSAEQEMSD